MYLLLYSGTLCHGCNICDWLSDQTSSTEPAPSTIAISASISDKTDWSCSAWLWATRRDAGNGREWISGWWHCRTGRTPRWLLPLRSSSLFAFDSADAPLWTSAFWIPPCQSVITCKQIDNYAFPCERKYVSHVAVNEGSSGWIKSLSMDKITARWRDVVNRFG